MKRKQVRQIFVSLIASVTMAASSFPVSAATFANGSTVEAASETNVGATGSGAESALTTSPSQSGAESAAESEADRKSAAAVAGATDGASAADRTADAASGTGSDAADASKGKTSGTGSDAADASKDTASGADSTAPEAIGTVSENDIVGAVNFTDVKSGKFYSQAVAWAVKRGVTSGVSASIFGVNQSATRAQVISMIYRSFGSPKVSVANPFSDVRSNAYYRDAVLWAVKNGVTSGTSKTTFSPGKTCTRAEVVTFLRNAYKGSITAEAGSEAFSDVSNKNYYYHPVLWALHYQITSGTSKTTFSPGSVCTRAQVVTFIYKADKAYQDYKKGLTPAPTATPKPTATPTPTAAPSVKGETVLDVVAKNGRQGDDAALPDGVYRLETKINVAYSVAVAGNSLDDRANVQLGATSGNTSSQWFSIRNLGNGVYTITNFASDKRCSVQYASKDNKGNVQQFHVTDHDAQKWYIRYSAASGYVTIVNKYSGKVLDVDSAKAVEGQNIQQYESNNSPAQQWKALKIANTGSFTGWIIRNNQRYYYKNGKPVTGKQNIGGRTYNFSDTGVLFYKTYINGYYYDAYGNRASIKSPYRSTINGKKTIKTLLQNAMVPCGRTLYIWGGGWGGKNVDSEVIGVPSSMWEFFTQYADSSYNYKDHRYEYGKGLDCSGFVAWAVYNTVYTKDNQENIVFQSSTVASKYQKKGWVRLDEKKFHPGDIVSMNGHVWICLGTYSDGSVLLVHSSPRGCQISGTSGKAAERAAYYMSKYYPEWPYAARTVGTSYLSYVHKGTWITNGKGLLTDPEGIQNMSADQVMKVLFGE